MGDFAPEMWASLKESGIDPATGHALRCTGQREAPPHYRVVPISTGYYVRRGASAIPEVMTKEAADALAAELNAGLPEAPPASPETPRPRRMSNYHGEPCPECRNYTVLLSCMSCGWGAAVTSSAIPAGPAGDGRDQPLSRGPRGAVPCEGSTTPQADADAGLMEALEHGMWRVHAFDPSGCAACDRLGNEAARLRARGKR